MSAATGSDPIALAIRAPRSGEIAELESKRLSAMNRRECRDENVQDRKGSVLDDLARSSTEMTSDVRDESSLGSIVVNSLPKLSRLLKVEFRYFRKLDSGGAQELLVIGSGVGGLLVSKRLDRGLVVGSSSLADECSCSSSLEVGDGVDWCVDGELGVVDTESVSLRIRVLRNKSSQNENRRKRVG